MRVLDRLNVLFVPSHLLLLLPQSLFGRMMNTLEELDTAADAFRKRYLSGHGGSATTAPARGVPPPAGSPTPSDTEFALLDAAYGAGNNNAAGSQQVAAMNRALGTVQEAEQRGEAESRGLCGMGGQKKSSASWFTQFRCGLVCSL
jgi:hypothetical protein